MATTQEFTYSDVSEHSSKKVSASLLPPKCSSPSSNPSANTSSPNRTCTPTAPSPVPTRVAATNPHSYVVIHDKVYNASTFVDEHPGGEEVLLDVGGQDATEAFEDVGHSDEAREILEGLLVGGLKRQPGDPAPSTSSNTTTKTTAGTSSGAQGMGVGLYAAILVGGALAFGVYKYLQANSEK